MPFPLPWAGSIERDRWRLNKLKERLRKIPLGGTAMGTCFSAPAAFVFKAEQHLRRITGLPLCRSQNLPDAVAHQERWAECASGFSLLAGNIEKIAGDIMAYNASSVGELKHPVSQYGSTIMPDKVNPVFYEMITGLCMDIHARARQVEDYSRKGRWQLNAYTPFLLQSFLELSDSMEKALKVLSEKLLDNLEPDTERITANLLNSPAMINTLRPHIVLLGIRNAGKSSLMNRLLEKDSSLVSPSAGTTTDPVTRAMELDKLGPVALVDTAGFDDEGSLGEQRVRLTKERLAKAGMHLFVTPANCPLISQEADFLQKRDSDKIPLVLALTHADKKIHPDKLSLQSKYKTDLINNLNGEGLDNLKNLLINQAAAVEVEISPLEGLVNEGDLLVLVTPIDLAAPKGRLILPQVQTIRDALDRDCAAFVVKERELASFYKRLPQRPKLIITDRQGDDIGTVKIPRLFKQMVDSGAHFDHTRIMPPDEQLKTYDLIIHCAGYMNTRTVMREKIKSLSITAINICIIILP